MLSVYDARLALILSATNAMESRITKFKESLLKESRLWIDKLSVNAVEIESILTESVLMRRVSGFCAKSKTGLKETKTTNNTCFNNDKLDRKIILI